MKAKDYISLRKQKYGFYVEPQSLESEGSLLSGWNQYYAWVKKNYPVQYFFRRFLYASTIQYFGWRLKDYWYKLKCQIFPKHPKIRKSIPKTWIDCSELVWMINFALILDFNDEFQHQPSEAVTEEDKAFQKWLAESVEYIKVRRPQLCIDLDNAYPHDGQTGNYQELYFEVDRLEKLINTMDSEVLNGLVKFREHLWT